MAVGVPGLSGDASPRDGLEPRPRVKLLPFRLARKHRITGAAPDTEVIQRNGRCSMPWCLPFHAIFRFQKPAVILNHREPACQRISFRFVVLVGPLLLSHPAD